MCIGEPNSIDLHLAVIRAARWLLSFLLYHLTFPCRSSSATLTPLRFLNNKKAMYILEMIWIQDNSNQKPCRNPGFAFWRNPPTIS